MDYPSKNLYTCKIEHGDDSENEIFKGAVDLKHQTALFLFVC